MRPNANIDALRLMATDMRSIPDRLQPALLPAPWTDARLWPNSRSMGTPTAMLGADATCWTGRYEPMPPENGGQQQNKLKGFTRDSTGAVLGGCTVDGLITAGDILWGSVVSDAGGYFELPAIAGNGAHRLVVYKAGSPDVAGTTVNNLIPT